MVAPGMSGSWASTVIGTGGMGARHARNLSQRIAGATLADLLASGALCAGDRNLTVHFAKKPLEPRASLCADGSITLEGATVASLSKLYIDVVRMNGIDSVTKGNGWANVYYEGEPLMARRDGAARGLLARALEEGAR